MTYFAKKYSSSWARMLASHGPKGAYEAHFALSKTSSSSSHPTKAPQGASLGTPEVRIEGEAHACVGSGVARVCIGCKSNVECWMRVGFSLHLVVTGAEWSLVMGVIRAG